VFLFKNLTSVAVCIDYCTGVLNEQNLKAFALVDHGLLALEFFIFWPGEIFHPKINPNFCMQITTNHLLLLKPDQYTVNTVKISYNYVLIKVMKVK